MKLAQTFRYKPEAEDLLQPVKHRAVSLVLPMHHLPCDSFGVAIGAGAVDRLAVHSEDLAASGLNKAPDLLLCIST